MIVGTSTDACHALSAPVSQGKHCRSLVNSLCAPQRTSFVRGASRATAHTTLAHAVPSGANFCAWHAGRDHPHTSASSVPQ
eukprot:893291-Prymnesium_polylepis.1